MKSPDRNSRSSQKGMSLAEALIAVAVFTVVFLAALALYQAANRAYMATDAATIQQQNARFAIDRITETLRDGGANYSPRGAANLADEQIEGAWESAIVVRGDFDNSREQTPMRESTVHPMVTTGNDEIVGYVLRKPGANPYTIDIMADVTPTIRDAVKTAPTVTTGEETKTIEVAARTLAEQTNPPYQLARVTFDETTGNPVYSVIAENIFRLSFSYVDAAGAAVITAATSPGSANAERPVRATVRSLGVNLISMADRPDFGYTDTNTYVPAEGAATKNRRKFALAEQVLSTNLGMKGRRHVFQPAVVLNAPVSITACTGHYMHYKISWPASTTPGVTSYQLSIEATTAPVIAAYTVPVVGTEYRFRQPDTVVRPFTFKVAPISAGNVGSYSPAVSIQTWHDTVNSIPAVPINVTGSQATGLNALLVNWDPVLTNTGFITNGTTCSTAGAGAGSSAPTSPWDNEAVDLATHRVFRQRFDGLNNGTFSPTPTTTLPNNRPPNGNQVDAHYITDLMNSQATSSGSVLTGLWNFTDHTAAPCSQYFYRVKALDGADLVAPGDGSAPMGAPVHFMPGATDQPAKPQKPYVVGAVGTAGGNFNVNLAWEPVVRTAGGARAATVHYRLERQRKVAPSTTFIADPIPAIPDFYEVTRTTEVVPMTVGGFNATYQYRVHAIYDCGAVGSTDRSDVSDWYELVCAPPAGNTIAVTIPAAGAGISRPYETGFAPRLTTVGAVWTGATIEILDPSGQLVAGFPQTISGAPTANQYNFPMWDSTGLPDGTYKLVAVGLAGSCQSAPVQSAFTLETGTCGLSITAPAFNNQRDQFTFRIQNTCDFSALSVSALRFDWFDGGANFIDDIFTPNASVNTNFTTGADNTTITFATPTTIPASGTSGVYRADFNDRLTHNNNASGRPGGFFSIVATIPLTPTPQSEEILVTTPLVP